MGEGKMLKRTITAIVLLLVLVPLIAIDHPIAEYGFLAVGIALSIIGGFEMMNAFYQKTPSLKYARFIVPFFCGVQVFMIYLQTTSALDLAFPENNDFIYHFLTGSDKFWRWILVMAAQQCECT